MSKNPPDYSFMKSGFNLVDNSNVENEKDIISLVTLFGKNALETAAKYTHHGKRTIVTLKDIRRALMFEVFAFTKRPDLKQKTDEIRKEIFDNENTFEEFFDTDVITTDETVEEYQDSSCGCALCAYLNGIETKWLTWEPQNKLECILKKHIDENLPEK
tara:strand:- start:237 stop:713 length:477 start_codon:yes stop_codon:yes gene_type:complete